MLYWFLGVLRLDFHMGQETHVMWKPFCSSNLYFCPSLCDFYYHEKAFPFDEQIVWNFLRQSIDSDFKITDKKWQFADNKIFINKSNLLSKAFTRDS